MSMYHYLFWIGLMGVAGMSPPVAQAQGPLLTKPPAVKSKAEDPAPVKAPRADSKPLLKPAASPNVKPMPKVVAKPNLKVPAKTENKTAPPEIAPKKPADKPTPKSETPTDNPPAVFASKLAEAISTDPKLQGMWAVARIEQGTRLVLDAYLSEEHRAYQAEKLQVIAQTVVQATSADSMAMGNTVVFPWKQLLLAVNTALASDPTKVNCIVESTVFLPAESGALDAYFVGRVDSRLQLDGVRKIAESTLIANDAWRLFRDQLDVRGQVARLAVDKPTPQETSLRQDLQLALATDPALAGSWANVTYDTRRDLCYVQLLLDSENAKKQENKVLARLRQQAKLVSLSANATVVIANKELVPIKTLLTSARRQVLANQGLIGCLPEALVFQPSLEGAPGPRLTILGRITVANQREELLQVVRDLLNKDSTWGPISAKWGWKQPLDKLEITRGDATEESLRQKLTSACAEQPALAGAWVDLLYDRRNGHYFVNVVVDAGSAEPLNLAVDRLLETTLPKGKYNVVNRKALPIQDLVARLQENTESDAKLAGSLIESWQLSPYGVQGAQPALTLVLKGRLAEPGQRDTLENMVRQFSANDPLWKQVRVQPDLSLIPPVPAVATYFHNRGVQRYTRRDYAGALKAFNQAMVNGPEEEAYRYWRVVCYLSLNNQTAARRALEALLKFRASMATSAASRSAESTSSLERVQGPVRRRLLDLERELAAKAPK